MVDQTTDTEFYDEDAILKEVWNINNVEAKTELNLQQIEAVNKSTSYAMAFNNQFLKGMIKNLLILQKSKERKSMDEFVQALQGKANRVVEKSKNYLNNLFG